MDINEVLCYRLTPSPLSLSHVNGSMLKSPKSALLKYLESKIISQPPSSIEVVILDAMFFMHLHSNLPSTFSGVARYLLARILDFNGNTIHFVTDKWIEPSIKDCERINRSGSCTTTQC